MQTGPNRIIKPVPNFFPTSSGCSRNMTSERHMYQNLTLKQRGHCGFWRQPKEERSLVQELLVTYISLPFIIYY